MMKPKMNKLFLFLDPFFKWTIRMRERFMNTECCLKCGKFLYPTFLGMFFHKFVMVLAFIMGKWGWKN